MRIVAGIYGSRSIKAVEGSSTRPTTDKVKEAIFSRLGPYFEQGIMLDLFAGSGNMSFEAISRGIKESYLCDSNSKAIRTIQGNIQTLEISDQCHVMKMDYHRALKELSLKKKHFNLVYLDPPYKKQLIHEILLLLDEYDLVKTGGDIVCESQKEDCFSDEIAGFVKVKDVTYGITRITYYKKRDEL